MNEIQQKQLALLNETAAFYNLGNRCVNERGFCQYYLDNKSGCAIGRLIEDKELCKWLDIGGGDITSVGNVEIFNQLPPWLQEYGRLFLDELQFLHDIGENWTDTGLSERGRMNVASIRTTFNLN